MKSGLIKFIQMFVLAALGVLVILAAGVFSGGPTPTHALPEFAENTGESCATCHVNPGGGGPRTMRGLLWSAQGRPDAVPDLGNILLAPENVTDGLELYDLACSTCHGASGEGLFGAALVSSGLSEGKIRTSVERGRERSGMPAFGSQFTEEQLEALVAYVAGIASGEIQPAPLSYPLPPAQFECAQNETGERCGGN